jgi:hypothetical protein
MEDVVDDRRLMTQKTLLFNLVLLAVLALAIMRFAGDATS